MVVFTTGQSLFDIYLTWKTSFRVCFCSVLVFAVPLVRLPRSLITLSLSGPKPDGLLVYTVVILGGLVVRVR